MADQPVRISEHPLRPAASDEAFSLHEAALEWSLPDPILIRDADDIQSQGTWGQSWHPFEHQVRNLFTFCRRLPVTLIADDVGLGKTISAGLIIGELLARRRIRHVLIVGPRILAEQWREELRGKFSITAETAFGGEELDRLIKTPPRAVVTTYETARSRLAGLSGGPFDMLVLDEAHRLRNLYPEDDRPRFAGEVLAALRDRVFKFVLMLTATPVQNRLSDLYSLVDCLVAAQGQPNPYGSFEEFAKAYLVPRSNGRKLRPEKREEFQAILRRYVARNRRGDVPLVFPRRMVHTAPVALTKEEQELTRVVEEHISQLGRLQQISVAQAMMSSPRALHAQVLNMAARGSVSGAFPEAISAVIKRISTPAKLTKLLELISRLRSERPTDWRVIVFTGRRETQSFLADALIEAKVAVGLIRGGSPAENQRTVAGVQADPPAVHLVLSTDAGAEGVNLQAANVLVNYDLPWNPMVVEQRIGRIQRLASGHAHVVVYNLVAAGGVEEAIVARLLEKLELIANAIGDIESILEQVGWSDGDGRPEATIEDLVIRSLVGQDVSEAVRLAESSIQEAKAILEARREEIDEQLGRLDHLHAAGPEMPRLTRSTPAMDAREFTIRAFAADGYVVDPPRSGVAEGRGPGGDRVRLVFDEDRMPGGPPGVFHGVPTGLYVPGHRDFEHFERLSQRWADHHGHRVFDTRPRSAKLARTVAERWCGSVPGAEFEMAEFIRQESAFRGSSTVRVRVSNAFDSYEKLVRMTTRPAGHGEPAPTPEDLAAEDLSPGLVDPSLPTLLAAEVAADSDVEAFREFYRRRCEEELNKVGRTGAVGQRIRGEFVPHLQASAVSIAGTRYDVGLVRVRFRLGGPHPYEVTLLSVPAAGEILSEPERATCQETGHVVPAPCLAACSLTGRSVLRHLLAASDASGRFALVGRLVTCPVSGQRVLPDELAVADVSGVTASVSLLRQSPVSGRRDFPAEFVRCEFSGVEVLRDEVAVSKISGRRHRVDETLASAVSGTAGHRSEFVVCEATGVSLLPHESGTSQVSGRRVRKDLLVCSEKASGRVGTADETVTCAVTGRRLLRDETTESGFSGRRADAELIAHCQASGRAALPAELVRCKVTGLRVLPDLLEVCAVSGKRGLRDRMDRSGVSGCYMAPGSAVRSVVSGLLCMPVETIQCPWLEGPVARSEAGVCALTGLEVARKVLNDNQELAPLRDLLDGRTGTERTVPEVLSLLTGHAPRTFDGGRRVWSVESPGTGVWAVSVEVSRWFGLSGGHAGAVVSIRGGKEILGVTRLGRRTAGGWW